MKSLRSRLFGALWTTGGAVVAVLGLAISIAAWVIPIEDGMVFQARTVVGVATPVATFGLVVVLAMATVLFSIDDDLATKNADLEQARRARPALPRATWSAPGPDKTVICLLEASELFAHGLGVSFYLQNAHGFEDFVGVGRVLNVQEDRRIQAILLHTNGDRAAMVESLKKNEKDILDRLLVKPTVPHDFLGGANA